MLTLFSEKKLKISSSAIRVIAYFTFSALFIIITNLLIVGPYTHSSIKMGHLLMTTIGLSIFLFYNKNQKTIFMLISLWIFIVLPIFIIKNLAEPDGRTAKEIAVGITESNLFAINIAITLISLLFLSIYLKNTLIRKIARLGTCAIWSISLLLPISFYCYWLFADSVLTSNAIIALAQTTPAEAIEYASYRGNKFIIGIVILILSLLAINILISSRKNKVPSKNNKNVIVSIIAIIGTICACKTSSNYITYPVIDAAISIKEVSFL